MAKGRAPRVGEGGHWVGGTAVALGVTFDLDAEGQGADAPFPTTIARAFERRRERYLDGGDRVYRRLRQRRAAAFLLRGRPRAASRELVHALWELTPADREAFLSVPARVEVLRPEPGLRHLVTPWISDEHDVRVQLASLGFQVGRSDLAARALLPSYRAGNPFAVLLQADILARDGDHAAAEQAYRAFLRHHPEHAALGELGLALVASYRDEPDAALRHLTRARGSEGAKEHAALLAAAQAYLESRGRASATTGRGD
jgi:predicted Zn-dependent protease